MKPFKEQILHPESCRHFEKVIWKRRYFKIIFNHEFAKGIWGNRVGDTGLYEMKGNAVISIHMPLWKYRLQQMVLEEEPLKYLEKFL